MIDPFHVQSKKAENKKKGWKFKEKKKSCVQHFEPGHGALHEHHHRRWWDGGQRHRARLRAPHPLLRAHCSLHIAAQHTVVHAVKQEGNAAFHG